MAEHHTLPLAKRIAAEIVQDAREKGELDEAWIADWIEQEAIQEILEALERLNAEVKGMLGFARGGIITEIGVTNVRVIEEKVGEAETAIQKAKGKQERAAFYGPRCPHYKE